MITIISRWELTQMPSELEWRMWAQVRGPFKISRFIFTPVVPEMHGVNTITQYATMEEALASVPGTKMFLEPTGDKSLSDFSFGEDPDLTLILGETTMSNAHLVGPDDHAVKIKSPKHANDMYGICAASIALAYWWGQ
jgi:hypothetical protein